MSLVAWYSTDTSGLMECRSDTFVNPSPYKLGRGNVLLPPSRRRLDLTSVRLEQAFQYFAHYFASLGSLVVALKITRRAGRNNMNKRVLRHLEYDFLISPIVNTL